MERHIAVLDSDHNAIGVIIADDKVNQRLEKLILAHYDADELVHVLKVVPEHVFSNDAAFIDIEFSVDGEWYRDQLRLQQVSIF